jgi:hypothetical protein
MLMIDAGRITTCRSAAAAERTRQAYHGREEARAQPAPSRHVPASQRATLAAGRCNGGLDRAATIPRFTSKAPSRLQRVRLRLRG